MEEAITESQTQTPIEAARILDYLATRHDISRNRDYSNVRMLPETSLQRTASGELVLNERDNNVDPFIFMAEILCGNIYPRSPSRGIINHEIRSTSTSGSAQYDAPISTFARLYGQCGSQLGLDHQAQVHLIEEFKKSDAPKFVHRDYLYELAGCIPEDPWKSARLPTPSEVLEALKRELAEAKKKAEEGERLRADNERLKRENERAHREPGAGKAGVYREVDPYNKALEFFHITNEELRGLGSNEAIETYLKGLIKAARVGSNPDKFNENPQLKASATKRICDTVEEADAIALKKLGHKLK